MKVHAEPVSYYKVWMGLLQSLLLIAEEAVHWAVCEYGRLIRPISLQYCLGDVRHDPLCIFARLEPYVAVKLLEYCGMQVLKPELSPLVAHRSRSMDVVIFKPLRCPPYPDKDIAEILDVLHTRLVLFGKCQTANQEALVDVR